MVGASTWRVLECTAAQVLVAPATGGPGKLAFWKGDMESRPVELGRALGTMIRELRAATPAAAEKRLTEGAGFDHRATVNLLRYLDHPAQSSPLPDHRPIVDVRVPAQLCASAVCGLPPPCRPGPAPRGPSGARRSLPASRG